MSTKKLRVRRTQLFTQQNGRCHWCGKLMVQRKRSGGRALHNDCTIDHIFDRTHPDRLTHTHGQQRYVAACYACNQARSQETHQWAIFQGLR